MITYTTRQTEIIQKEGQPKFRGKTTAKDFRGWLSGQLAKATKSNNNEMYFVLKEIQNAYNFYEPERKLEVSPDQWQGKSSFEILYKIDGITIIKYQKPAKGEEPKEVITEVNKDELTALVGSIRYILEQGKTEFKTQEVAYQYCIRTDDNWKMLEGEKEGDFWKNFFNNRKLHNKFTLMLGALDKMELIEYKGGKIKVLDKEIELQSVLQ